MNFHGLDEIQEDFFSKLDQNLPEIDFFQDFNDQSSSPFPQNLTTHQTSSPDSNIFSSLYPSDSQRSERVPDSLGGYSSQNDPRESYYSLSSGQTSENYPDPLSRSSHKISKFDSQNPKRKPKITTEHVLAGEIPAKYIPEEFNDEGLDEKERKKILQMIRNRVAAQNSRDKKKNHMKELEEQNKSMCLEIVKLKKYIKQLEEINMALQKENQEVKLALMNAYYYHNAQQQNTQTQQISRNEPPQSTHVSQQHVRNDSFESTDSSNGPSNESSQQSVPAIPVIRRGLYSGSFLKYSIAVLTIFAVVMFTGVNSPDQATYNSIVQRTAYPNQKMYSRRFLQQEDYYKDYFILDPRYKDWTEDPTYLFEEGKIYENLFDYLKSHLTNLTDLNLFFSQSSYENQKLSSANTCPNNFSLSRTGEVCIIEDEAIFSRWKELKLKDPNLTQAKKHQAGMHPNVACKHDGISVTSSQAELQIKTRSVTFSLKP